MFIILLHTMLNWQPLDPNSKVLIVNNVQHQDQKMILANNNIYSEINQDHSSLLIGVIVS